MKQDNVFFLPEGERASVDILLVTGDAYLDHPSFGTAIISRVLENAGYTICIVSQPDYKDPSILKLLPEVSLFIGITSGNLDSIVSNFTGSRNRRRDDCYSIDGDPNFPEGHQKRPDRALIVYTAFLKSRYKGVPVVLGGIEASLRRFAHYDFVQDKIRQSVIVDSKADILVYGMGEAAILEIAKRVKSCESLENIRGTAVFIPTEKAMKYQPIPLPSCKEIQTDKQNLMKATELIESNMTWDKSSPLCQHYDNRTVISFPPQQLPTPEELDKIYKLPYRRDFPDYCERVPAWKMIKDSITSHRGCYGRCSFCAIASHQGPIVSSRTEQSIIDEAKEIVKKEFFKGTISDVGGPTANSYGSYCKIGGCKDPNCLYPDICPNLVIDEVKYAHLLKQIKNIPGVKNVFVASGLRYDIALQDEVSTEYIIVNHTSGHLKVAPEHTEKKVLNLMRKPDIKVFEKFIELFEKIKKKNKIKFFILPYIILSHPGSDDKSAESLGKNLVRLNMTTKQYQDFTPTPGTISTAMFVSGKDRNGNSIYVQRYSSDNNPQRKILEHYLRTKKK